MADNTTIVSQRGDRALLSWGKVQQDIRAKNPMISPEQLEKARQSWLKVARQETGTEPAEKPAQPDPNAAPGTAADAERAAQATVPPKPPPPAAGLPVGEQVANAFGPYVDAAATGVSGAYRALKQPFEQAGEEVTDYLTGQGGVGYPDPHTMRHAAARAALHLGITGRPTPEQKQKAKQIGRAVEKPLRKYAAPLAGGVIEYAPEMAALHEVPGVEKVLPKSVAEPLERYGKTLAGRATKWIPGSLVTGAGIGAGKRFAQGQIAERDPHTGQVIPPATAEDLSEAARETATGFTEAEGASRALGYVLGAAGRGLGAGVDWWEGSANRPMTEHQATPTQPTPPVRDETAAEPAFVKELNTEETPPTASKKEPAAPNLNAQNERTDKPGSGAGGTDPDDQGDLPASRGPTSASVPPGVAPGDIREDQAVAPTTGGQGSSEQFKPRPTGPVRDHFKQIEEEHRQAQEEADNAAHTFEVGPRREAPGMPRNIEDLRRQLRGEPEEPPAPLESRAAGLPRTLMDYLRNPRGYAADRPAAPAAPARRRVGPPVTGDRFQALLDQLRGRAPEPQGGPTMLPADPGRPAALIDEQRREREAEEAARQTQVEKGQKAAEQAELQQRVQNRQERDQAGNTGRLFRLLARDREQRALDEMRGVERPGWTWTGPEEPRGPWPDENEGWRWPQEEKPKGKGKPKPPVEPEVEAEPQQPAPEPMVSEPKVPEEPEAEPGTGPLTPAERSQLVKQLGYSERSLELMGPDKSRELLKGGRQAYQGREPSQDSLQNLVKFHADEMRDAPAAERGEPRRQLRQAARALKDILTQQLGPDAGPEEAGRFVREQVGDGIVTKALDDILGDQLKRPKTAAPGGRPGRGRVEAAKPTTTSVLPTEEPKEPAARRTHDELTRQFPANSWVRWTDDAGKEREGIVELVVSPQRVHVLDADGGGTVAVDPELNQLRDYHPEPKDAPEKEAIFAVRMKDGSVHDDPDANFHVDVMDTHDLDPDQVKDTGFIWKGKYHPGNPKWSDTGEGIKSISPPAGLPNWIKPEDVTSWKLELENLRKDRAGELEPDPDEEVSLRGKEGALHVEGYPNTPFRYEVVERGDLVTSHDTEGNPNPEFPENIQQRSLDRAAYQETQRSIRNEMQPERLFESPSAVEGAPVVANQEIAGKRNVVLGGKQRTAALQALEEGSDADEVYQNALHQRAADFGINPADLEGFAQPTLIRRLTRRLTDDELQDFAPNTDVSPSMALSPSEKAKMDAKRLTPEVLDTLDVTESGSLNTEGNLPFIRSFVAKLPATERGALVTDNGFLNSDGLRRVQNAVLTRAYNVGRELHPAIARMFESTDDKVKTIQHALLRAAPDFAAYRGMVDSGLFAQLVDVMTPLLDAASTVSSLRERRLTIQDWIDQADLGGKDRTIEKAMHLYRENTTVPDLTDALKYVATVLHNLPSEKAGDLFERPALPSPAQIFDMARDPDALAVDEQGEQRIADTIRELNAEIRQAREMGDFAKVERLEAQRKLLTDEEPPC